MTQLVRKHSLSLTPIKQRYNPAARSVLVKDCKNYIKVIVPIPAHRLNNVNVLLSNITCVIFAVLDVSFAVNSCLNHVFLHLYLRFHYISVAVTWYRVHGTWSTQFLRCSCSGSPISLYQVRY